MKWWTVVVFAMLLSVVEGTTCPVLVPAPESNVVINGIYGETINGVGADLNGDGIIDAAVSNWRSDVDWPSVSTYYTTLDGVVSRAKATQPGNTHAVSVGDYTGNGNLDVIASTSNGLTYTKLYTGDGAGGITFSADVSQYFYTLSPHGVDIDKDGIDDFVGTMENRGSFTPPELATFWVKGGTWALSRIVPEVSVYTIGHFDNSTDQFDIVYSGTNKAVINVAYGTPSHDYENDAVVVSFPTPSTYSVTRLYAFDVDSDASDDLVVALDGPSGDVIAIYRGPFVETKDPIILDTGPPFIKEIAIVDLEGDSFMELVALTFAPAFVVFRISSLHPLTYSTQVPSTTLAGEYDALTVYDGDANGFLDINIQDQDDSNVAGFDGRRMYFSVPVGPFLPLPGTPINASTQASSVLSADLDGNGALDVLYADATTGELSISFASTSKVLAPPTAVLPGGGPSPPVVFESVIAADMDGDACLDIVGLAPTSHPHSVIVLTCVLTPSTHGYGAPMVLASTSGILDSPPDTVLAVNLNGDDLVDLVLASSSGGDVGTFVNGETGPAAVSSGVHADLVLANPQAPFYPTTDPPTSPVVYAVPSTATVYAGPLVLGTHVSLSGLTALALAPMDHLPGNDLVWAAPGASGVTWVSSSQNPDPALLFDFSSTNSIDVGDDVVELSVVVATFDGLASLVVVTASRTTAAWVYPVLALGVRATDRVVDIIPSSASATSLSSPTLTDVGVGGTHSVVFSSSSHGVTVVEQDPNLGSTQASARILSLTYPECGGIPNTVVCVAAALARTSPCLLIPPVLDLPPGPITRCRTSGLPFGVPGFVTIRGASSLSGPPSVFECGAHGGGGGALFSISSGARVRMEDFEVRDASANSPGLSTSPLMVGPSGELSVENVTFSGLSSGLGENPSALSGRGGAIQVSTQGSLTCVGVTFERNSAGGSGGAITVVGPSAVLSVTDCVFEDNTAVGSIGGPNSGGGSIAVLSPSANVVVANTTFVRSTAGAGSGGVFFSSGAALSLTLTSVDMVSPSAGLAGGALALVSSSGSTVHWTGSGVVTGASAAWGGVVSVSATVPFPLTPAASELGPGTGASGIDLTIEGGVLIQGGSAVYGGLGFVCDGSITLEGGGGGISGSFVASIAGGRFFTCSPFDSAWVAGVGPLPSATFEAGAYGPMDATPPVTLTYLQPFPSEAASGESLVVELEFLDEFGSVASDPTVSILARAVNPADLSVSLLGTRLDSGTGKYTVEVSAAVRDWPADLYSPLGLSLTAGTTAASRTTSVTFTECPPGQGRSSLVSEPLLCLPCEGVTFSVNRSTDPCESPVSCGGNALLIGQECVDCPDLSIAARNASSAAQLGVLDCTCVSGAWIRPGSPATAPCLPCPPGGFCEGGDALPVALPDWYPLSEVGEFIRCPIRGACEAGDRCAPGYDPSFLCRVCASGYHRVGDGSCEECPSEVAVFTVLLVLLLVGVAVAAFIVSYLGVKSTLYSASGQGSDDDESGVPYSITVLLLWIQTVALLYSDSIAWPSSVRDTMEVMAFSNVDISVFKVECNSISFAALFWFKMFLPPIFAVAVTLTALGYLVYRRVMHNEADGELTDVSLRMVLMRILLSMIPLTYIPMSRATLVFFDCQEYAGQWFNDANLEVECGKGVWLNLLPLAVIGLMVYVVGPPLLVAVLMYRKRHWLNDAHTRAMYGPVYSSYRSDWYLFTVFSMLWERLTVVVVVLFASASPAWLFAGLIFSFLITLQVVTRVRPFRRERHTALNMRLSFSLLVLTILGVFFWAGSFGGYSDRTQTILVVVTFAVLGISILLLGGAVAQDVFSARALRIFSKTGGSSPSLDRGISMDVLYDEEAFDVQGLGDMGGDGGGSGGGSGSSSSST